MQTTNLQTASTYINNLLLARGLLRGAKPIEFLGLLETDDQKCDGGSTKTVQLAEVMNLVHDLILKRDRDAEQHEKMAETLRILRSEASSATAQTARARAETADLRRALATSESSARGARAAASTAETTARTLREELAKAKAAVVQVRAACATDVRRHDVQIQTLKSHLTARQRGSKSGVVGASITIKPGAMSRGSASSATSVDGRTSTPLPSVTDVAYSLKQETTEFLTMLGQQLSDENDSLISLVRETVRTLRELQGLPPKTAEAQTDQRDSARATQSPASSTAAPVTICATSYEALSTDLEQTLQNLNTLLTNPSFAPIEEVHARDEEIHHLRAGWEKMEARWHEAVRLMQSWRERMQQGGDAISLDELRLGIDVGNSLQGPLSVPSSAQKARPDQLINAVPRQATLEGDEDAQETSMCEDSILAPKKQSADYNTAAATVTVDFDDGYDDEDEDHDTSYDTSNAAESGSMADDLTQDSIARSLPSSPEPARPQLREINGNSQGHPRTNPPSLHFNTLKSAAAAQHAVDRQIDSGTGTKLPVQTATMKSETRIARPTISSAAASGGTMGRAQTKPTKLSVPQKLEIAANEASEARKTQQTQTVRSSTKTATREIKAFDTVKGTPVASRATTVQSAKSSIDATKRGATQDAGLLAQASIESKSQSTEESDAVAPVSHVAPLAAVNSPSAKPLKRNPASTSNNLRISGRPRKRKSTLSPDELEELMGLRGSGDGAALSIAV